jgi:hypothetical protein
LGNSRGDDNDDDLENELKQDHCTYHLCSEDGNLYELGWQNFGQAWSIWTNPSASYGQRFGAGAYMSFWGGAHAMAVVGGTILLWEAIVPGSMSCIGNPACQDKAINTGTNTVYQVVDKGKTIYVGITKNFPQRAAYWQSAKGWAIQPIKGLFENLSRSDARAVEQVLIERVGLSNLANQINSIAASNPVYNDAITRGNFILNQIGFGQ